ncbi:hypothetical protein UR09_00055 [Candidatus Nitromaritima sp. SCGC AAA799-A02]|nr:hypothetical protein UZ36_00055 [Candidatus Nitromaritima sp. SCGC AAA799-C22]KMP12722.1 hypothetical protein UR09_00055 [Candidatus Nitromaritima sp. SCGC AAA799-A02]
MEAIVLAGGLGTRLRETVPDAPKPLAPVNGKPFLCHLLDYWLIQGISYFIMSVGYKHQVISDFFGDHYKATPVSYAIEPKPLGTGGGVLLSMTKLQSQDPFLILNGDTFFAVNRERLVHFHNENSADMTLCLVEISSNDRYSGVKMDANGCIQSMETRIGPSKSQFANGGVYLINRNLLSDFEPNPPKFLSLEDDIIPELLKQKKRIMGFVSSGTFIDIGIPSDYYRAAEVLPSENSQ